MGLNQRYTSDGSIFYKQKDESWVVQLNYTIGAGAPFKTVKWATWSNANYILELQETNEGPEMWGWELVDKAGILLYCKKPEVISKIKDLQALVRLGYKGHHATSAEKKSELRWRFNV